LPCYFCIRYGLLRSGAEGLYGMHIVTIMDCDVRNGEFYFFFYHSLGSIR